MYNPYDSEKYPERKNPRLKGYDYSTTNFYFVTICTHDKRCIFGQAEATNGFGKIAERGILEIPEHYPGTRVEKYVVMPNHVHVVLYQSGGKTRLDNIVGSYKAYVSRKIHETQPDLNVWQVSFHDHIIRDQKSYENIWLYIDSNPINWEKDCFFAE